MKWNKLCLIGFLLLSSSSIPAFPNPIRDVHFFAGGKLQGKVMDISSGIPLEGAVIYIHEIKIGTTSSKDGTYQIANIPAGKYLVEVSFIGYSSFLETITIDNIVLHDFAIKPAIAENEAVTVTGVASVTKIKQTPQPVSVVKKADLFKNSSTNIIDALASLVPGINTSSTGPAIAKPVIRGLGYNRVITIHDGIRQEGQQWGDEHGIEVDEYSVQKAEVLKGPSSLLYGSDGMGGAVHLITNTPVERGTIKGNLNLHLIDNNAMIGSNANLAGHLQNGFNWNLYGTLKSAGDYRNKWDGHVLNSRYNEKNWGGYFGVNRSWGYSHFLFSSFNQEIGVIEGNRDLSNGQFLIYAGSSFERTANNDDFKSRTLITPYQGVEHVKFSTDHNIAIGTGRLTMNLGFQRNQRKEFSDPVFQKIPALYFDLQTVNYNLQYLFAEKNGWKTAIGLNGMLQQNKNSGEEVLIPEYRSFDVGTFVYSRKTFSQNLTLSGGIRADRRNLESDAYTDEYGVQKFSLFSKHFANLSGSVGLSYNLSDQLTLKTNISRGYRAPSVSELASNGTHEGTSRYEYGDLQLKSETSLQLDAGIEMNTDHVVFMLNAFYNSIDHYIYYSKLNNQFGTDSVIQVSGEDLTVFKYAQSGAKLYGFEAKLDLHPHPLDWLHFSNSFSMVNARLNRMVESANRLPFIPPAKWITELRCDFKNVGKIFANLYLKTELENVFTQNSIFTAYNTETVTPGYSLLNIAAGADILARGKKIFSVYLTANNLTDVAYQQHLSRLKYTAVNQLTGRTGVFNMGRNMSIKINVPLKFAAK